MFFVTVGIMAGTPVPETAVKFVDRVCGDIETVHKEAQVGDANLAGIANVLNVLAIMLFQVVGAQLFEGVLALLVITPG